MISYDIRNDKLRTRFYKFIKQYGYRMQYSVYRIDNSKRYLNIIKSEIQSNFEPKFSEDDSVLIFEINDNNVVKYGKAIHEDEILIMLE